MFLGLSFLLIILPVMNGQSQFVSDCVVDDNIEFIYVDEDLEVTDAAVRCAQLSPPATLAIIPSASAFFTLNSFLLLVADEEQPWIGLRRNRDSTFPPNTDFTDPAVFFQPPNNGNFGDVRNGEFPWRSGHPDGQEDDDEACVL